MNSLTHVLNPDGSISRKEQRKVGVIKKRKRSRVRKTVVRLDAAGMKALRIERYEMDGERCTVCGKWCPLEGDVWTRMHLAHVKSRGAGGDDTIPNTRSKCPDCHLGKEHGPKWSAKRDAQGNE